MSNENKMPLNVVIINNDYAITPDIVARSLTLTILQEQIDDDFHVLNLRIPKEIKNIAIDDVKNVFDIMGSDGNNINPMKLLRTYDTQYKLLKYLRYTGIVKFESTLNDQICKILETHQYNNDFLINLLESLFVETFHSYPGAIQIDIQDIVDKYRVNAINNMTFMILIERACKGPDPDSNCIVNLTGLVPSYIVPASVDVKNYNRDISFEPAIILNRLRQFSYQIFDDQFLKFIELNPNICIAGGSLLGAITGKLPVWSDIDLWVSANNPADLILKTSELINQLEIIFKNYGYADLTWSTDNNIITLYCPGYMRNIQIIMITKSHDTMIKEFDMDYVQVYFSNNTIYGTVNFLRSLLTQKIYQVNPKTNTHRIIKALLKGYEFDHTIIHQELQSVVKSYKDTMINENSGNVGCIDINSPIKKIIMKVINKFYFPIDTDYQSLVPDEKKYILHQRITYMINMMCGHNNIFFNTMSLREYLDALDTCTLYYNVHYNRDPDTQYLDENENESVNHDNIKTLNDQTSISKIDMRTLNDQTSISKIDMRTLNDQTSISKIDIVSN
jgi:hypothetical protein